MIRADLNRRLQQAIDALVRDGRLPAGLPAAEVADPRDPTHGDFATNFALVASKPAGKNPRELAEMVREAVSDPTVFESIEVAGPGFINFRLTPGYVAGWLPSLLAEGEQLAYAAGKSNPNPQRINVEFVSVNPTGRSRSAQAEAPRSGRRSAAFSKPRATPFTASITSTTA